MPAATPERIVSAKRFMGKLEKLYKVSPLCDTLIRVCHVLKACCRGNMVASHGLCRGTQSLLIVNANLGI